MILKGHIVICNWHPHVEEVIRMLSDQARIGGRKPDKIVVITKNTEEIIAPCIGEIRHNILGECMEYAIPPRVGESEETFAKFLVVRGNVQDSVILQSARVATAKTVIVFPEKGHPEPDSTSLMLVLNIRKEIEQLEDAGHTTPRVIAWCQDPKNVDLFLDPKLGLTDVCSSEWAWRMICQATHVDHVTDIYRRLMTSTDDSNEIYQLKLGEDWKPIKFGEIQQRVDRYNQKDAKPLSSGNGNKHNTLLLLGYSRPVERIQSQNKNDNSDISNRGNWEKRRQDGLHINPDFNEKVVNGDSLLILTYSMGPARRSRLLKMLNKPL